MKKLLIFLHLLFLISAFSFAQSPDIIIGKYHLPNNLDIEIFKKNNKYFGKIIGLNGFENGQTQDIKNPKKSNRSNKLLGKVIIKNLEYDYEEKQWINGSIYGVEKGIFLDLKIKENKKDAIVIEASKYLFWKTMEWKKI